MGEDLLAGIQRIADFLHDQGIMVEVGQGGGLVGRGDMVNPLPLGIGLLQGLDRRNSLARILRVDEHLFRHGVFQGRGNQAHLEQVVALLRRIVRVLAGDVEDRDVHGGPARFDGAGDAEEIAHVGLIAVGAGARRQRVVAVLLEPEDMGQADELGMVAEEARMEQIPQEILAGQAADQGGIGALQSGLRVGEAVLIVPN
jgi:hypothetical protein